MAHDSHPFDSRYSWIRLLITLLIAVMGNVGMWVIVVVLPEVQAEFGEGRALASLPYATTMIGFALGNMVIGRWVDRFGMAWSLSGAALLIAAAYALAALAPSILNLSLVQFLVGFGTYS